MIATLARASVEGALLVVVVWLLARVLRVSPATRTVLWWCAAAKFLIAFMWTAPIEIPVLPVQSPVTVAAVPHVPARAIFDANAPAEVSRRDPPGASGLHSATGIADRRREWSFFAATCWVLGLTAAALAGLRRWRVTVRMLRESTPAPRVVVADATELATRVGLRRPPDVRLSASVETPLVMGLLRPVVLLPANRLDALSDAQRRMVICHELAHLKRADLWLGCIPALAERMFFFHPLAHLASREYALAREAACDASVMRTLDAAPRDYGRLLLALGVSASRRGLTVAGAAWSFQNLKRRISMLQDITIRSRRSRVPTAAVVGLAVAALLPLRLVARSSPAQRTPASVPSVVVDTPREPARERPQNDQSKVKSERLRDDTRGVRFVLLSEDGSRTTNNEQRGDVERAERLHRHGEALLWFRIDDKEYVIRDPEVLRQARALWTNVYHHPLFDADALRELTQSLDSLRVDDLAEHGALLAQSVDSAIPQLIVDHSLDAAEIGLRAAEQALRGLSEGGLAIDEAKLDQQLHSIDMSGLEQHMRTLEKSTEHLGQQIERSMREFEHHVESGLEEQLKELDRHVHDFDVQAFAHLGGLGRSAGDTASQAAEKMRALIQRAIKNGQASPVR